MEEIARTVAPVAITVAALVTASNLGARITGLGFVIFTIGSVAWFIVGLESGQAGLMWQNVILFFINLFGVWRWLGRRAAMEAGGRRAHEESEKGGGEGLVPLSALVGMPMRDSRGEEVGKLADAMVGERGGRLVYGLASSGGVAGAGEHLRRVDWAGLRVEDDALRLAETRARFEARPQVERDDWPSR